MNKFGLVVVALVLVAASFSFAAHPTKMSLQGSVEGLVDGNLGVKVSDSNSCTTVLYDQNYLGAIEQGSFNILLGDNLDLNLNYNTDYYLCLSVNGEAVGGAQKFVGGQGQIHITDVNASEFSGSSGSAAGSTGQLQFNSSGAFGADGNLFWDDSNKFLGVGTSFPGAKLHVQGGSDAQNLLYIKGATNLVAGTAAFNWIRADGYPAIQFGEYNHGTPGDDFPSLSFYQSPNGGYYGSLTMRNSAGLPTMNINGMPVPGDPNNRNLLAFEELGNDGSFAVFGKQDHFEGVSINNGRGLPNASLKVMPFVGLLTGTVTDPDCSGDLVGTNTKFLSELKVGGYIYIDDYGDWFQIESISDDTHLHLVDDACTSVTDSVAEVQKDVFVVNKFLGSTTTNPDGIALSIDPVGNVTLTGDVNTLGVPRFSSTGFDCAGTGCALYGAKSGTSCDTVCSSHGLNCNQSVTVSSPAADVCSLTAEDYTCWCGG